MLSIFLFFGFWSPGSDEQVKVDATMTVDYILLDVTAIAEDGSPATDLTAKDFELRDQRKKVKIEVFDILDFRDREQPETDSEMPRNDGIWQTLILLLDFDATGPDHIRTTIEQVSDFLFAQRERDDLQIFIISLEHGFVTQGFTTDPALALEDLMVFEGKLLDEAQRYTLDARQQSLATLEGSLGSCFPKSLSAEQYGPQSAKNVIAPCLESAYKVFSERQTARTKETITRLEKVVHWLARVDGLKSLYLISPGLAVYPGQAAATMTQQYLRSVQGRASNPSFGNTSAGSRVGANPGSAQDDPFAELDSRSRHLESLETASLDLDYQRLVSAAMAFRTVVHTFTLPRQYQLDRETGVSAQTGRQLIDANLAYNAFDKELEEGLVELSHMTGGYHRRTGALAQALRETVEGHRFYYVLGYRPPDGGRKGFRKIELECKRPDIELRYHSGYLSAGGKK